ncbi:MAG: hypothetical protein P8R39_01455, partial [Alphaproteobacteria bacterium]|nr:hypothetical protein [Alphaproteobacteria bacterium]
MTVQIDPETLLQAARDSVRLHTVDGMPIEQDAPLEIVSEYEPAGDQPQAIKDLLDGLGTGERDNVLLGVTGSGKTFTM